MFDYVDSNHHTGYMTQVSRFLLKPEVWEKVFDLFSDTFLRIKDKEKLNNFFDSFFSPTEKIMLAKRLAIAVLLAKGNDYHTIKTTLRVTSGTVSKVKLLMNTKNSGLKIVVEYILDRDSGKLFWQEIINLLDYPHKSGGWPDLYKRKYERKKKTKLLRSGLG